MSDTKPGQIALPAGEPFDGALGFLERGEADVTTGLLMAPDRTRLVASTDTAWTLR